MNQMIQKATAIKEAIDQFSADGENPAEAFRISFLGTKGSIKSLMGEMKEVASEDRRQMGQLLHELKLQAEQQYDQLKGTPKSQKTETQTLADITLPGELLPLGSRHPISIVRNRI